MHAQMWAWCLDTQTHRWTHPYTIKGLPLLSGSMRHRDTKREQLNQCSSTPSFHIPIWTETWTSILADHTNISGSIPVQSETLWAAAHWVCCCPDSEQLPNSISLKILNTAATWKAKITCSKDCTVEPTTLPANLDLLHRRRKDTVSVSLSVSLTLAFKCLLLLLLLLLSKLVLCTASDYTIIKSALGKQQLNKFSNTGWHALYTCVFSPVFRLVLLLVYHIELNCTASTFSKLSWMPTIIRPKLKFGWFRVC